MTSEEKIQYFRNMTREELEKILEEEEKYTERDIVIASIELGERDFAEGNYYTTEEVLEHIFGKSSMVK